MCFLHVLFFNLVCYSVLSYCSALHCQYKPDPQPQLFIDISGTSTGHIEATCITRTTNKKTITFSKQDTIQLNCNRVIGTEPWYKTVELQWELEQFNQKLMITEGIKIGKKVTGSSSLIMNIDSYDDGLIARCSSNGSETHNSIYVQFKYNGDKEGPDINKDIKNMNITEGQMLRNEFANSVIMYNAPGIKADPRVILNNDNIFHYVTLEDNGAIYAGWEKTFDLGKTQTVIVKRKWLVHVEPANSESHLPIVLGIGGISCLVIFIIIIVCCKYCKRKNETSIENPYAEVYEVVHNQPNEYQVNHPNPTPEERDYAEIQPQNDRVVYATIEMRGTDKPTTMQDSAPYAKIIGVIRNKNKVQSFKMLQK